LLIFLFSIQLDNEFELDKLLQPDYLTLLIKNLHPPLSAPIPMKHFYIFVKEISLIGALTIGCVRSKSYSCFDR
jgi:hypothetical protein